MLNRIPVQRSKDSEKFQISKVAGGVRSKDYFQCVQWLADAGLIHVCPCLHFPELPLEGSCEERNYKLCMRDTGLLVSLPDEASQDDLRARKHLGVCKGALWEQITADALVQCGYPLYHYKKVNSTLEEDFFVRTKSSLIPLKIKARGSTSKALRTLTDSGLYPDIRWGIRFTMGTLGNEGKGYTFPLFLMVLLRRFLSETTEIQNVSGIPRNVWQGRRFPYRMHSAPPGTHPGGAECILQKQVSHHFSSRG